MEYKTYKFVIIEYKTYKLSTLLSIIFMLFKTPSLGEKNTFPTLERDETIG